MLKKFLKHSSVEWQFTTDKSKWFTFIEVIVAVTVFSIMMISVIFIFINSSEVSLKIDVNRALQENSKNIIETIAEDLRKNNIKECAGGVVKWCRNNSVKFSTWVELWIWDNHYYLAKKVWTDYILTDNTECSTTNKQCFVVKNWEILSNSSVKITNLNFTIFSEHIPKVQINFLMKPMLGKWVKSNLIKNNEINIQTTLSERYLKN